MFTAVRAMLLILLVAFSASTVVGTAAAATVNFSVDAGMADAGSTMIDCTGQASSKVVMKACNLICSATCAFALVPALNIVFSDAMFVLDHPRVDLRADSRALDYDSPPPRSFILI